MIDFQDWDLKMQKLYDVYTKFDIDITYTKDSNTARKEELQQIERIIGTSIPASLKETFRHFSKTIFFSAYLPDNIKLPHDLRGIFSAQFLISTDELINAEDRRKGWMEHCFCSPNDPYDTVWHNKLGFMTVPNGDIIAFDLNDNSEDKHVVYLSHDDGEGHGYILGENFADYFSKLLQVGGCGNEDWQMIPFIPDNINGINPDCENAKIYREFIGLHW